MLEAGPVAPHRWRHQPWLKFAVIGITCLAQQFPLSIADRVLPPVARANGLPASAFWLFSLALIPMWTKILWAPLIDRIGSPRWGRRKSIILPATLLSALTLVGLGFVEPGPETITVAVAVFLVHTLLMSTQDIAVDAYTVDNLSRDERAIGSAVKSAFETGGALVAAASILAMHQWYGWLAAMVYAAAVLVLLTVPFMLRPEPPAPETSGKPPASLMGFFRRPDIMPLAAVFIFTGAANVGLATMASIFFVDAGLSLAAVGLVVGTLYAASEFAGAIMATVLLTLLAHKRVFALIGILAIPANGPLIGLAFADEISIAAAAVAIVLPVLLLGGLHAAITVQRLGWSEGPQAGTDFTGFGTFYNLGRMVGIAVGGPALLVVGWAGYFTGFALFLCALGLLLAWAIPRLDSQTRNG